MSTRTWQFTSESVTEGHPDKVSDQISDAVLDAVLAKDPDPANARVACETVINTGLVLVTGEIRTEAYIDIAQIARDTICKIGYDRPEAYFDGHTCGVLVTLDEQSPDIAGGVDVALEVRGGSPGDALDQIGAGDQGMVFGYATDETPELMPMPISLAHRLARRLAEVRHDGTVPYLMPDGKTQVTVRYENNVPVAVTGVLISTQHKAEIDLKGHLAPDVIEHVVHPVLGDQLEVSDDKILINPSGRFVIGGPVGDAGLTGRKIIVDTYGGMARHGGGAFSGKDATKIDRSAAYAARWVAKHIVGAGLAKRAELQIAYAIGVASPVSYSLETFGTETVDPDKVLKAIPEVFDLRPAAMIRDLNLLTPTFSATAAYGHFGRADFAWEKLTRLDDLKGAIN